MDIPYVIPSSDINVRFKLLIFELYVFIGNFEKTQNISRILYKPHYYLKFLIFDPSQLSDSRYDMGVKNIVTWDETYLQIITPFW